MKHLSNYEKVESKYLICEKEIMKGNAEVIWGLINNLWCIYNGKPTHSFTQCSSPSNLLLKIVTMSSRYTSPHELNKEKSNNATTVRKAKADTNLNTLRPISNTISPLKWKEDSTYLTSTNLPYSLDDLKSLESNIINWLKSLNILKGFHNTTLLDIEQDIVNGSIDRKSVV